jgi:hypothetical protein
MTHPNAAPTPHHRLRVAHLIVDDGSPISEPSIQIQREGWVGINSATPVPGSNQDDDHDKKKNNRPSE